MESDRSVRNAENIKNSSNSQNTQNIRGTRNIKIEVKEINRTIDCLQGQTIMEALRDHDIYISAVCGGKGRCGKCGVQVLEGFVPVKKADEQFFTKEELEKGYRLSCLAEPKSDMKIRILSEDESDFEILSDGEDLKTNEEKDICRRTFLSYKIERKGKRKTETACGVAIDIGTTTLAAILLNLNTKQKLASSVTINRQRAFGADVISRMLASNQGAGEELQRSIQKDLQWMMKDLVDQSGIAPELIRKVVIGGNTTMGHLLMGYSCETLGVVPFTPININTIIDNYASIIGNDLLQCEVTILPGISTFVGGDIVAGLLSCDFHRQEKISLLIDLGTNGEMALGNREKILVTSTAAGPAFEGGNISCGMGSVPGAICNVEIKNDKAQIRTIGDKPPIGLCGTGVLETISELRKEELVDETGLLEEEYAEEGFLLAQSADGKEIRFTQKDVREIQLAKSAVRAGLETLLLRYGVSYDEVDTVYLAGGFGYKIDREKAVQTGLLPEEFLSKIKAVGNSSLSGAALYLSEPEAVDHVKSILKVSEEISLASDKAFQELYMQYMMFE